MINRPLEHPAVTKPRLLLFYGALLGKYKHVKIKMSGGCYLSQPIDLHLKGFEALGGDGRLSKRVLYDRSGRIDRHEVFGYFFGRRDD